jgi:hypothetical protein
MKKKKRHYKHKASVARSDLDDDNEVMTWLECQTGTFVMLTVMSIMNSALCCAVPCTYLNYLTI